MSSQRRESLAFGIGAFQPKCLQFANTIQGFVIVLSIYSVFAGMFSTYTISQLTTIEKHFAMSSESSGFLFTIGDIGFFVMSPIMGHFFTRLHRPRVLAACSVVQALSKVCFFLPFVIHMAEISSQGETLATASGNGSSNDGLCNVGTFINNTCDAGSSGNSDMVAYGLLAFGMFLNGAGATGLWTVGISYIDDNAGPVNSPKYLGALFCLRFLSPMAGSVIGSAVSHIHVHLEDVSTSTNFIGAWWLGYMIFGGVTLISAVPLMMFPRALPKVKEDDSMKQGDNQVTEMTMKLKTGDEIMGGDGKVTRQQMEGTTDVESVDSTVDAITVEQVNVAAAKDMQDFHRALWRIVTNLPFMLFALGLMMDIAGSVAYASFLPKYLEDQFYLTPAISNIVMGVCVPFSDAIGVALGGWFTSMARVPLSRLFLLAVSVILVIYVTTLTLLVPTCPTMEMMGIYNGSLVDDCNANCQCDMSKYRPLCGADGLTYYSPCFAGCTDFINETYANCNCMAVSDSTGINGVCTDACDTSVIIYAVILFSTNLFMSLMTMPFVMFILRIVDKKDKGLGQATINVSAALASMPAATLFGRMIDHMCVLIYPSKSGCQDDSGACLRYDRDQFRYEFHLASFALRFLGSLIYVLVWWLIRNRRFEGDDERCRPRRHTKLLDFIGEGQLTKALNSRHGSVVTVAD